MVYTDTIAAIATALSSSGIGIIRISGSDAVAVAERMFEPAVMAVKLLQDAGYELPGDVTITSVCDEEGGGGAGRGI